MVKTFPRASFRPVVALTSALVAGSAAPPTVAEWIVFKLHPAGAASSAALGVFGGQQVGWSNVGNQSHAGMWSGTADSWVDLHPANASFSMAEGVCAGQQVGSSRASSGAVLTPCLWSGTAASWTSLRPLSQGSGDGDCAGTSGTQQVGWIQESVNGAAVASLWSGTASSWISLLPVGALGSRALAAAGDQQVGHAGFHFAFPFPHDASQAGLWTGSPGSWVNLDPDGTDSAAYATDGIQQVGVRDQHATLWNGTAASRVDLHPQGAVKSAAYGVFGGRQVGDAGDEVVTHATVWAGTAASRVDLHNFLPPEYQIDPSHARGIWSNGRFVYVVGYANNPSPLRREAILWALVIPPPCPEDLNADHQVNTEDLVDLLQYFGQSVQYGLLGSECDLNQDGVVNTADLTAFLGAFGTAC